MPGFKPLSDNVLVRPDVALTQSPGGLFIPTVAEEKRHQGVVIAVGPGKVSESGRLQPVDIKQGDKVLYDEFAGTEITIEGTEHRIMPSGNILGVIEE